MCPLSPKACFLNKIKYDFPYMHGGCGGNIVFGSPFGLSRLPQARFAARLSAEECCGEPLARQPENMRAVRLRDFEPIFEYKAPPKPTDFGGALPALSVLRCGKRAKSGHNVLCAFLRYSEGVIFTCLRKVLQKCVREWKPQFVAISLIGIFVELSSREALASFRFCIYTPTEMPICLRKRWLRWYFEK